MPQDNWRWCNNCHGLYFAGNNRVGDGMPGRCSSVESGDRHYLATSHDYVLVTEGEAPGQPGWRWCVRCAQLWYALRGQGRCFAGGGHVAEGSGRYVVPFEGEADGQTGWRWCRRCECLWYGGERRWCPAGGYHVADGSGAYVLTFVPPELAWFDAESGPYVLEVGVSQWYDRREPYFDGDANFAIAGTSDSGTWPRFERAFGRPAVRFGDDLGGRPKGLPIDGRGSATSRRGISLFGTPYTVMAVVSRTSARGDNYPVATAGLDCGVFGCARDSALHLGWQGERTVRFGQYYNDLDVGDVPAFRADAPRVTILAARSDASGKTVAVDEAGFSRVRRGSDPALLRTGDRPVSIGGPPRGVPPDFHFNGHVFELILWATALSPAQFDRKRGLLRQRYGVGGAAMAPS